MHEVKGKHRILLGFSFNGRASWVLLNVTVQHHENRSVKGLIRCTRDGGSLGTWVFSVLCSCSPTPAIAICFLLSTTVSLLCQPVSLSDGVAVCYWYQPNTTEEDYSKEPLRDFQFAAVMAELMCCRERPTDIRTKVWRLVPT